MDTRVSSPGKEKDQRYVCKLFFFPFFFNSLANCKSTSASVLNKSADFHGDIFKQNDQHTAVERNNVNSIKSCLCTGENMVNTDKSRVVG